MEIRFKKVSVLGWLPSYYCMSDKLLIRTIPRSSEFSYFTPALFTEPQPSLHVERLQLRKGRLLRQPGHIWQTMILDIELSKLPCKNITPFKKSN